MPKWEVVIFLRDDYVCTIGKHEKHYLTERSDLWETIQHTPTSSSYSYSNIPIYIDPRACALFFWVCVYFMISILSMHIKPAEASWLWESQALSKKKNLKFWGEIWNNKMFWNTWQNLQRIHIAHIHEQCWENKWKESVCIRYLVSSGIGKHLENTEHKDSNAK